MKKFILSALVALFGFAAASAQGTIFNNPANRAYFGVRVGADITCPGNVKSGPLSIDMFGNGAGIEFGGIYNIPLVANLYIEPGSSCSMTPIPWTTSYPATAIGLQRSTCPSASSACASP